MIGKTERKVAFDDEVLSLQDFGFSTFCLHFVLLLQECPLRISLLLARFPVTSKINQFPDLNNETLLEIGEKTLRREC